MPIKLAGHILRSLNHLNCVLKRYWTESKEEDVLLFVKQVFIVFNTAGVLHRSKNVQGSKIQF